MAIKYGRLKKSEDDCRFMRILIHTDEYYPTAQACSYRMRTMADAFIDQGDEVVVIASSTNKGNGKICGRNPHADNPPRFCTLRQSA